MEAKDPQGFFSTVIVEVADETVDTGSLLGLVVMTLGKLLVDVITGQTQPVWGYRNSA